MSQGGGDADGHVELSVTFPSAPLPGWLRAAVGRAGYGCISGRRNLKRDIVVSAVLFCGEVVQNVAVGVERIVQVAHSREDASSAEER